MQNIVLYDALSFTSKIHGINDVIEQLGLENCSFQSVKGAYGYRDRLYYDNVSIHYNGRDDMGIWCELTGQGCRVFETLGNGNYESIFEDILYHDKEMNLTRLDVAYDDHEGIIDIEELANDARSGSFVSKFNDWQVIDGNKGITVNHGSMKSEIFIRIYDKAKERGYEDRHWIRAEMQLRRDRAKAFIKLKDDIGKRYSGVMANYLRYVDETNDNNKWRWPMKDYWERLINSAAGIKLYEKPGTEYNLEKLKNYVFKQSGNAIDAAIKILGIEEFLKELNKRGTMTNPKYEELVDLYGRK